MAGGQANTQSLIQLLNSSNHLSLGKQLGSVSMRTQIPLSKGLDPIFIPISKNRFQRLLERTAQTLKGLFMSGKKQTAKKSSPVDKLLDKVIADYFINMNSDNTISKLPTIPSLGDLQGGSWVVTQLGSPTAPPPQKESDFRESQWERENFTKEFAYEDTELNTIPGSQIEEGDIVVLPHSWNFQMANGTMICVEDDSIAYVKNIEDVPSNLGYKKLTIDLLILDKSAQKWIGTAPFEVSGILSNETFSGTFSFYKIEEAWAEANIFNIRPKPENYVSVKDRQNRKIELKGLVLDEDKRKSIITLLSTHSEANRTKIIDDWGFGKTIEKGLGMAMLFYGPPGTGKTKCAEIIAKELKLKFKLVDPGMIWSSEPGQAERTIQELFKAATESKKMLLCFDECEVLIANRHATGVILAAQTNVLLQCLERYEGISIFTTNRAPVLDPAFERRLQLKMEFDPPSEEIRILIWKELVPKKAPLAKDVCFKTLSKSALSGGHIKNVVINAARKAVADMAEEIEMKHFLDSLKEELNGMAAFSEEDPTPIGLGYGNMQIKEGISRIVRTDRQERKRKS